MYCQNVVKVWHFHFIVAHVDVISYQIQMGVLQSRVTKIT